jgi:hypothetical protein
MITWKDISSHNRGDKQPTVLQADLGEVDLIVHRHIYHSGWVMSSDTLGVDIKPLIASDLEQAKKEALVNTKYLLDKKISEFNQVCYKIWLGL